MNYEKQKERRIFMEDNKLIIYKNSEGNIVVDAIYKDETLWLSQKGMSKVFECSTDNKELDKKSVTEKCSLTADDGKNYNTTISSLDAIIAVGYRINSKNVQGEKEAKDVHYEVRKKVRKAIADIGVNLRIVKQVVI